MSKAALTASLSLWLRRLNYRKKKLASVRGTAHSKRSSIGKRVSKPEASHIHKWEREVKEAETNVERRQHQLANLKAKPSARDRVLSHAKGYAGRVKENPAGSNGGGMIDAWERRLGFGHVAWCGIFAANMLIYGGVKNVTSRLASVYFICMDAQAKRGCFRGWTHDPGSVMRGDLAVLFGPNVHVEIVDYIKNGIVYTVGGNTSSGPGGSQSNGGGVFKRARSLSDVYGFALVDYPGR